MSRLTYLLLFFIGITLVSCSSADEAKKPAAEATIANGSTAGVVGIFDLPEMLTLSIMDSASTKDIALKMGSNYSTLEEEAKSIGAELDGGSPGIINYNSDPNNLKFECILLIKKIPAQQPVHSKVVALEAGKMLVYNFYGPYEKLITAYDSIRKYCAGKKLKQSGPVREFYLSDPTTEKDPAKWLTRIIVPVQAGI